MRGSRGRDLEEELNGIERTEKRVIRDWVWVEVVSFFELTAGSGMGRVKPKPSLSLNAISLPIPFTIQWASSLGTRPV